MHHHHSHIVDEDSHGEDSYQNYRAMLVAFALNLAFAIIEMIGGFYTNSMAIISDSIHDLGDSVAIGFAIYMSKISNRGRDEKYSYGYRRFTILGAIINSIILLTGSALILFKSVPRLFNPESVISEGMIVLSVLGIVFNYFAYKLVHKKKNLNDRTISLHLLEDLAGWVAVLVGSVVIYFYGLYIIDPILSILIAIFITYTVIGNLKSALSITMQSKPQNINVEEIRSELEKIKQVKKAHHIHIWSLDGQYNIMTVHIKVPKSCKFDELEDLKSIVRERLSLHNVDHATIELEFI